jgi:hypothetical protein
MLDVLVAVIQDLQGNHSTKYYILTFLLMLVNEESSLKVRIKSFDLGFE